MCQSAPKVSVVLPVYNVAGDVKAALDSVLAQDFTDFELICVNDGSTDSTLSVIAEYSDPRIRVISQISQGLVAARNAGIHYSRGEYIALMNTHDRWQTNKLYCHVAHLQNSVRVGVSYSPALLLDAQGQLTGQGYFPRLYDVGLKEMMCRNPVGNGSAGVIRRSVLNRVAALCARHESGRICYFDEHVSHFAGLDLWLKITLTGDCKLEGISVPVTHLRIHPGGQPTNLKAVYTQWHHIIQKYRTSHPARINRWYSLAHAYQLRNLARSAALSGKTRQGGTYFFKAVFTDWRIIAEEPGQMLTTVVSVCLSILPRRLCHFLKARAMKRLAKKQLAV